MLAKTVLPAHQARSRESLARLLKATMEILDEEGLEGATIPRISARAKLSPGAVYRRFPDKDAMMREVCLRVYEDSYLQTKDRLAPERWQGKSLQEIVGALIGLSLQGHRAHRGLIRALSLFILQHPDAGFVRKCEQLQGKAFQEVTNLLLTRRREIRHPHPEDAVRFAMLTMPLIVDGILVLSRDPDDYSRLLPNIEAKLQRELPIMFLRFLGIED
jgi:AcrR family transcriptional regulator